MILPRGIAIDLQLVLRLTTHEDEFSRPGREPTNAITTLPDCSVLSGQQIATVASRRLICSKAVVLRVEPCTEKDPKR